MPERVGIIAAGNTLAPSLATLRALGFDVRRERPGRLVAESDRLSVHGRSTIELLGLVKMFEIRGENWLPTREEVHALLRLEGIDPALPDPPPSNAEQDFAVTKRRRSRRKAAAILLISALVCMTAAYAGLNTESGVAYVQRNAHIFPVVIGAIAAVLGALSWPRKS